MEGDTGRGANLSEGEKPDQDCGPRSRFLGEQKLEIQTQQAPGSCTGSCSDVKWRLITVKWLGTPLRRGRLQNQEAAPDTMKVQ